MLEPRLKEKTWNMDFEKEICLKWREERAYAFVDDGRPVYSIDTPPPYVNTPIHIGHATTYTLMDMFARFRRMRGFNVLFPLGLDRNGLPIEMAAEKKFNVSLKDIPREKFLGLCKEVLEESSQASIDSFTRLGISFNSWKEGGDIGSAYYTDSTAYRALTQATFIEMWNKGLIYEDKRLNNYCPGCGTTLADDEVVHKDVQTSLNHVVLRIKETGEDVVIATTRPELLCTAALVIFNPEDKRYAHLDGKNAIIPFYGIEVPVKPHPFADPAFGTGLVFMSRSAGDQDAIRFLREMNIEPLSAITTEGRMDDVAGFLKGMKAPEARQEMVKRLKDAGLLVKQENILHRIPVCERSKHTIEYITMPEFYLKQVEYRDAIRRIAHDINFFSRRSRQILLDWIDSVSIDWAISRRRYYATEIPLWYCASCNTAIVPPKGKYYQPWREKPPVEMCRCGSSEFRGEERVLDTWFDSSISPLYILKFGTDFFRHAPCSLRPQGKEIVRNWLYYTLLRCYHLTAGNIFRDAWIHYHVVDDFGKKMSKSVGNVIDPHKILERFGAEPFRLWCATEGNIADSDIRCSFERIEGAGKTITKLWNAARFISMFDMPNLSDGVVMETDKAIINELNAIVELAREKCMEYDFHLPAARIKNFLWEAFASNYVETVKSRAYNQEKKFTKDEQLSALFTLHHCLRTMLKLLAPVIPMITYKIYGDLYKRDIHMEGFPEPGKELSASFDMGELMDINSRIWKAKKEKGLSLKSEVKKLVLPAKFSQAERDLVATHNIKNIDYGDRIEIEL